MDIMAFKALSRPLTAEAKGRLLAEAFKVAHKCGLKEVSDLLAKKLTPKGAVVSLLATFAGARTARDCYAVVNYSLAAPATEAYEFVLRTEDAWSMPIIDLDELAQVLHAWLQDKLDWRSVPLPAEPPAEAPVAKLWTPPVPRVEMPPENPDGQNCNEIGERGCSSGEGWMINNHWYCSNHWGVHRKF